MQGINCRCTIDDAPGAVLDLSASGVQVKSAVQVRPSQSIIFKIGLSQDRLSAVLGRVQWVHCEPANRGAEASYRMGLAFEVWDVQTLKSILERCRWAGPQLK